MFLCCLLLVSELRLRFSLVNKCVHLIFNSVLVAERPPFGKKLLIRLTICSHCILTICNFSYIED